MLLLLQLGHVLVLPLLQLRLRPRRLPLPLLRQRWRRPQWWWLLREQRQHQVLLLRVSLRHWWLGLLGAEVLKGQQAPAPQLLLQAEQVAPLSALRCVRLPRLLLLLLLSLLNKLLPPFSWLLQPPKLPPVLPLPCLLLRRRQLLLLHANPWVWLARGQQLPHAMHHRLRSLLQRRQLLLPEVRLPC